MKCKACNKLLMDNESFWIEALQVHNDMCYICKPVQDSTVEEMKEEDWLPLEPCYPSDLIWDNVQSIYPDSDD